jgi:hypothetical protein
MVAVCLSGLSINIYQTARTYYSPWSPHWEPQIQQEHYCLQSVLLRISRMFLLTVCVTEDHQKLCYLQSVFLRIIRNFVVHSLCYWGTPENLLIMVYIIEDHQRLYHLESVTELAEWPCCIDSVAWTMVTPIQGWGEERWMSPVLATRNGESQLWETVLSKQGEKLDLFLDRATFSPFKLWMGVI